VSIFFSRGTLSLSTHSDEASTQTLRYKAHLRKIGIALPNNQRQHRILHIQEVLPYALRRLLCPVSAGLASIFRMGSISTSYPRASNRD
jgi:hypothetical protein